MASEQDGKSGDKSGIVEIAWDPITRVIGSLGIHTKVDFGLRKVIDCYSTSSIFRGYSVFMKGKDPRDAHFISSRICGICGDNHATCSVCGLPEPPTKVVGRSAPFQRTTELATKLLPETLRVNADPPNLMELGEMLAITGTG